MPSLRLYVGGDPSSVQGRPVSATSRHPAEAGSPRGVRAATDPAWEFVRNLAGEREVVRLTVRDLATGVGWSLGSAARWLRRQVDDGALAVVVRGSAHLPSVYRMEQCWNKELSSGAGFQVPAGVEMYATLDADSIRDCIPNVPVLLPASSWARKGLRDPKLPEHIEDRAADGGGFVATLKWGDYKYTFPDYVAWLQTFRPRWAATLDYCCEDEITSGRPGVVRERQQRTTEMAWRAWLEQRDAPWCWVPTVQGWEVSDYARHARDLAPLVERMRGHYGEGSAFRVGIGTLCQRAKPAQVRAVVNAVASELPDVPLHLWGVTLRAFQPQHPLHTAVVSFDTSAFNGRFGRGASGSTEEQARMGLTQREHRYVVALPRYRDKLTRRLDGMRRTQEAHAAQTSLVPATFTAHDAPAAPGRP